MSTSTTSRHDDLKGHHGISQSFQRFVEQRFMLGERFLAEQTLELMDIDVARFAGGTGCGTGGGAGLENGQGLRERTAGEDERKAKHTDQKGDFNSFHDGTDRNKDNPTRRCRALPSRNGQGRLAAIDV